MTKNEAILACSHAALHDAGIMVATMPDGKARIGTREHLAKYGGLLWSADDMLRYISMPEKERHLLLTFRLTYGGTIEWKSR